jgi:hypothetical protein
MRTIYKYPVSITDWFKVEMPGSVQVLHVGMQGDQPMMWVEVDPEQPSAVHHFAVVGTGHPVPVTEVEGIGPVTAVHCGTWLAPPFVWHLYEVFL